jgi:stage III sporulation protein AG
MAIRDKWNKIKSDKKTVTLITIMGGIGICLIMISSLLPDNSKDENVSESVTEVSESEDFCSNTEKHLTEFLRNIDGVGEVKVYLTVSNDGEYVYATEDKISKSENKTEEESEYVIIGGNSDKTALIRTVRNPEINGVIIACTGGDSAIVQETVYKAVSTVFDIPTYKIYVTRLKE